MNFPNKLQHWLLALALVLTGVLFYLKVAPNRPAPANHLTSSKPIQGEPARAQVNETFGKLPLYFVENLGQVPAQAAYYVQGSDKGIYFTDQGLTFVLNGKRDEATLHRPHTSCSLISQPSPKSGAQTLFQRC